MEKIFVDEGHFENELILWQHKGRSLLNLIRVEEKYHSLYVSIISTDNSCVLQLKRDFQSYYHLLSWSGSVIDKFR